MTNIVYKSDEIESFYKKNRFTWDDFYPSEKVIFEKLGFSQNTSILDLGCGCGGLGNALNEQFGVTKYLGVDINQKAIKTAQHLLPQFDFIAEDILEIPVTKAAPASFDVVISLGCIDWNVEFFRMLKTAISYVKPGGFFVSSFRLSNQIINTPSYQYINFQGQKQGEKAPYIVLDPDKLLEDLLDFKPKMVIGYGYWGTPSKTVITPYKKICFAVLALAVGASAKPCKVVLDLPEDLRCAYGR